jgi:hypothetical protein
MFPLFEAMLLPINTQNCDTLWKIRCFFDMLNDVSSKYASAEHLWTNDSALRRKVGLQTVCTQAAQSFRVKVYKV